ncbi:hypothetical protein Sjap_010551 [Stephania japonica]|uniref:RNA cytidine acetyltransferase n=1 Tax=Stephania japonica TaxID=461633 RepID=A0AAP0J9L5_9MAGN
MLKKVDERIRTLIENGVKARHRSMLVIVGDKSRDQIVNLHHLLNKASAKARRTVLWCYKDKLDISSHKKKRAKEIKKLLQSGQLDPEKVDAFSLFVETGGLTYCQYKDSERILGNTFGMCILQDFEALTPNLLARTIETVEGGGLIVLMLRTLSSLTSLYTMVMDVHERFRTEAHAKPTARFNERFLLSLASCKACVVMDDELNILPISSHMESITPVPVNEESEGLSNAQRDLKNLKEELIDAFPVGPLIKKCCTLDQGKAVTTFLDAILDKALRSTVALLAARGCGKSAALGLSIAGAIAAGYSNIFVTAPSPDNLKTLFEFVRKGLEALEYKICSKRDIKGLEKILWRLDCLMEKFDPQQVRSPPPVDISHDEGDRKMKQLAIEEVPMSDLKWSSVLDVEDLTKARSGFITPYFGRSVNFRKNIVRLQDPPLPKKAHFMIAPPTWPPLPSSLLVFFILDLKVPLRNREFSFSCSSTCRAYLEKKIELFLRKVWKVIEYVVSDPIITLPLYSSALTDLFDIPTTLGSYHSISSDFGLHAWGFILTIDYHMAHWFWFVTSKLSHSALQVFEEMFVDWSIVFYGEHLDFDVVKSDNSSEYKKATIRMNIYKQHRQTIQYIQPHEHEKLSQVELLVVDEAAAIPLPIVKSLIGPYLVFLSSTVNGYEGTGRSLSLKLLQQLEEQSRIPAKSSDYHSLSGRLFTKVELSESIRYASGDPIETWLNGLLCLDVTSAVPNLSRLPPPSECELYYVNRDTLFSYHKESELILQQMMALYVASHYKNSPNDLQLLGDAPAHHLFVLLGPVDESKNHLPDILCVIQVFPIAIWELSESKICLEGKISRDSAVKSLSDGHQPSGDQIPWKFCEQYQDTVFPSLSGARILGYGSIAVELLTRYFEGQMTLMTEIDFEEVEKTPVKVTEAAEKVSLLEENIKPRADLPPLFVNLSERPPEELHYLGVSFGLTLDLFRFWRRHKFAPFYICQIPSAVTGEHACMVIKALDRSIQKKTLDSDDIEVSGSGQFGFFTPFYQDFRLRFARLLGSSFREMEYKLAMSVLDPKINFTELQPAATATSDGCGTLSNAILSPYDMKRLEAYCNNLVDFHMILDLVPVLAQQYFQEKIPVTMPYTQASVLLCMGLQNQNVTYIEGAMKLERQLILSLFIKTMRKFQKYLYSVASKEMSQLYLGLKIIVPSFAYINIFFGPFSGTRGDLHLKNKVAPWFFWKEKGDVALEPHSVSLEDDLDEAAKEVKEKMKAETAGLLDPEMLQQYAIADREADFENALQNGAVKISSSGLVSVKSNRTKTAKKHDKQKESRKGDKKRGNLSNGHGSNKKKKV